MHDRATAAWMDSWGHSQAGQWPAPVSAMQRPSTVSRWTHVSQAAEMASLAMMHRSPQGCPHSQARLPPTCCAGGAARCRIRYGLYGERFCVPYTLRAPDFLPFSNSHVAKTWDGRAEHPWTVSALLHLVRELAHCGDAQFADSDAVLLSPRRRDAERHGARQGESGDHPPPRFRTQCVADSPASCVPPGMRSRHAQHLWQGSARVDRAAASCRHLSRAEPRMTSTSGTGCQRSPCSSSRSLLTAATHPVGHRSCVQLRTGTPRCVASSSSLRPT